MTLNTDTMIYPNNDNPHYDLIFTPAEQIAVNTDTDYTDSVAKLINGRDCVCGDCGDCNDYPQGDIVDW